MAINMSDLPIFMVTNGDYYENLWWWMVIYQEIMRDNHY